MEVEAKSLVASARSSQGPRRCLRDLSAGHLGVGDVGGVEGRLGRHPVADGQRIGRGSIDQANFPQVASQVPGKPEKPEAGVLRQGETTVPLGKVPWNVGLADTVMDMAVPERPSCWC